MRRLRTNRLLLVSLLVLISLTGAKAAVVFIHTVPVMGASLSTGCSTLTATYNSGNSTARLTCGIGTAISVASTGTNTPTFTIPASLSNLYLVPTNAASVAGGCSAVSGSIALTSGTPISFTAGQNFVYCAGVSTLPTTLFTVTWSQ